MIKFIYTSNPVIFIQSAMRMQNQQKQIIHNFRGGQSRIQNSFEIFTNNIENI